jgi:hypothetical protein
MLASELEWPALAGLDEPEELATMRERPKGYFGTLVTGSPWTVADISRLLTRIGLGLAAVVIGWVVISGTTVWRTQVIWTAVATGGVAIASTGAGLWLIAGFGTVARERRAVIELLRQTRTAAPAAQLDLADDTVVTAPSMTRFHRPDCPLVKGKSVSAATYAAVARRNLQPCGMCQP